MSAYMYRVYIKDLDIKNRLGEKLKERYEEIGCPDLLDKIADETVTDDLEKLAEHLVAVEHPAMEMGEMV